MADETDPKQPVDLKARLGLQNKLDTLAAGRRSADTAQEAPPLKANEVQQPPRPHRFDQMSPTMTPTMEAVAASRSPRSVVIIASIVIALVVLGAGYVIGKSFQMRSLYNVQIDNAEKVYDIVFERVPDQIELKRSWVITRDLLRAVKSNSNVPEAIEKAKESLKANKAHPILAAAPEVQAAIQEFLDAPELNGAPNAAAIERRAEGFLKEVAQKSSNVALMKSFFDAAFTFNASIEELLQEEDLSPEQKTAKLFENFEAFLLKAHAYRAYNIRFPLKDIARKDFYFVTVVPDIARLDALAVKLNSVTEAMVQDKSVFQFIQKSRELRSGSSEQFTRLFWIKGNRKQNEYDEGHLIMKLYQKEKIARRQMGQAVALQEKPDDPILIPVGDIAKISLGGTIKPYVETFENTVRGRMLGNQRARLKMILDLGESFGVQSLQQKVDEYRSRDPYFVL